MPDSDVFDSWCRRLRDGDRRAYASVFEAMHDPLFRYARSITKNEASARDLTQDVFVRLWDVRETLDPNQSLEAYLYRMVRNRAYNHQRNQRTRTDKEEEIRSTSVVQPTPLTAPDVAVDVQALDTRLRAWIDDLPDRQREALSLSRFEGLSHDAIADVMGISSRTVNNHIVRALRSLRDQLRAYQPELLES